jgi:hypothetical protein
MATTAVRDPRAGRVWSDLVAKRGRHHRQGGRVTPKGTRPAGQGRPRHLGLVPPQDASPVGDLLADVRAALRSGEPLDLLALVSTMMSVFDPRLADPFERRDDSAARASFEDLVVSFIDVPRPETTALLAALAALLPSGGPVAWSEGAHPGRPSRRPATPRTVPGLGELTAAALQRAVVERGHRLPGWLEHVDDAEVTGVTKMTHVLGDGDNVIVGVRIPPRHELSVVVYIDHNLGGVVKDAFVVPEGPPALIARMRRIAQDPDTEWREMSAADARARITDAVDSGAMTWPPFETDTWPACRPLVEWIVRFMPAGGTIGERAEWSAEETDRIATTFLASPEGARHRPRARREMLDSLLWYGTGYGRCDPLRWSQVSVEIVLTDWVPRKVVAPVSQLRLVPDVLRDLVRFGHRELGIRRELTDETLDAVDSFEPAYLALIRTPRPQGVDAIVQSVRELGGLGDDVDVDDGMDGLGLGPDLDPFAGVADIMLDSLADEVGGPDVLRDLDDRPLPDEPFATAGVPPDLAGLIGEITALCDRWFVSLGEADPDVVELRTATRRLLARIVDRAPEVFRRRATIEGTAAAACWAVASANGLFDGRPGSPRAGDLSAHFGRSGSPSTRARTMLHAARLTDRGAYGPVVLPPEMLTSRRRGVVIAARDRWLAEL